MHGRRNIITPSKVSQQDGLLFLIFFGFYSDEFIGGS